MYFSDFPKILYSEFDIPTIITDITLRTKFLSSLDSKIFAFELYTIKDGDRPDTISYRYYGRSDLDWLILIANNIISMDDWPKTDNQILNGLLKIYGSITAIDDTNNTAAIHHYENSDGLIVSFDYEGTKVPVTILQNEIRDNDLKRDIRLIKKEYVGLILQEQQKLLQQ